MCGRFSLATSKAKLQELLPGVAVEENLRASFNIAPTQHAYVLTNEQPDRLQYLVWGLVPYWSEDGKNGGQLINARSEGIESRPSFRVPIRSRRCIVPADSFYEWRSEGRKKLPYRILSKTGGLLAFAGVWDVWYRGDYALKTFSIITAAANQEVSSLHNRMPVLLHTEAQRQTWLGAGDFQDALALLHPPADGLVKMYRVSEQVNSVVNDFPGLHQEMPEQPTLFD